MLFAGATGIKISDKKFRCVYMHGSRGQVLKSYLFAIYCDTLFHDVCQGRYDTINSHLSQMFTNATVSVNAVRSFLSVCEQLSIK